MLTLGYFIAKSRAELKLKRGNSRFWSYLLQRLNKTTEVNIDPNIDTDKNEDKKKIIGWFITFFFIGFLAGYWLCG